MQIETNDLKKYIEVSRSCGISGRGLVLESINSTATFSFDNFEYKNLEVLLLRGSGSDGHVFINGVDYTIPPNKPLKVILESKKISLRRAPNCVGEVYVKSVFLNEEDDSVAAAVVKENLPVVINCDWNVFLKKIGKTKGIKKIDIGLMASEFAEIENGQDICDMKTDPPAAFKRSGNKIVFIHPCRIFEIQMVDGEMPPKQNTVPTFIQEKIDIQKNVHNSDIPSVPILNVREKTSDEIVTKEVHQMVYNSGILRIGSIFNSSNVFQSGGSIKMNNLGKFSVPLSVLKENARYFFNIKGNRGNGNGKIGIQLGTTSGEMRDSKIFSLSPKMGEHRIELKTGAPTAPGSNYCLIIYRPPNASTGDVYINNISSILLETVTVSPKSKPKDVVNNRELKIAGPVATKDFKKSISAAMSKGEGIIKDDLWKLSVPKVAHFYWGGRVSFLRYVSIYSFIKNNPDWKVKLHVPEILGNIVPAWKTGEQKGTINIQKNVQDYSNLLYDLKLEIVRHNFDKYGFKNSEHEVHKSDLLRWILLSTEGGLWSDSDIIYTHPMFFIPDNIDKYKDFDTGVCKLHQTPGSRVRAHAIGFLMSSGNNAFYRGVLDLSKKHFNRGQYQSIGSTLLNKRMGRLNRVSENSKIIEINPDTVYSISDGSIEKFLSRDTYIQDYKNAIGFHWYGGSQNISQMEATVTHINYHNYDNFLGKLVYYTMNS